MSIYRLGVELIFVKKLVDFNFAQFLLLTAGLVPGITRPHALLGSVRPVQPS